MSWMIVLEKKLFDIIALNLLAFQVVAFLLQLLGWSVKSGQFIHSAASRSPHKTRSHMHSSSCVTSGHKLATVGKHPSQSVT